MVDELQCQFCQLKFSSTYKLIPHIFFGHRKKILKKIIQKKEDLVFKCPAGCNYESRTEHKFSSGFKPNDDEFVSWLSNCLLPIEIHINTHTQEPKATRCEYCSLELGTTIYWNHLSMHMLKQDSSSPDKLINLSSTPSIDTPSLPSSTVKQLENRGQKTRPPSPPGPRPPSPPGPPPPYSPPGSPPASPPLQTAKAPEELAASTIPFSSFFKKKSASPENKLKSSLFTKEDTPTRIERSLSLKEDSVSSERTSSAPSSSSIGSTSFSSVGSSSLTSVSGSASMSSLSGSTLSSNSRQIDSLSSFSPRSSLVTSSLSALKELDTSKLNLSVDSATKLSQEDKPSPTTSQLVESFENTNKQDNISLAPLKEQEEKPAAPKPPEKHKISLSEYTKIRKKQQSEDKDASKITPKENIEAKSDTTTELAATHSTKKEEPVSSHVEQKVLTSELNVKKSDHESVTKERRLSTDSWEVQELTKERKLSGDAVKERRTSGGYSSKGGDYTRRSEARRSDPDFEPGKVSKHAGERMRPPTPLDIPVTSTSSHHGPTTPTAAAPGSEGSSRSTTPGLSRPTTPAADRSRRTSSDQRTRRLSDNTSTPKEKPKPVLTEEMERQIIFGGALLKGTKLSIPTEQQKDDGKSEKSSPEQERRSVSRGEEEKRKQDERESEEKKSVDEDKQEESRLDKDLDEDTKQTEKDDRDKKKKQDRDRPETREEKLKAVREEIERRFQEEEQKRRNDKEAQKKHEAELREKIRIEEEKLRKEKEKIAQEKKRAKEEKRKAKRAKRKRKRSGESDEERKSDDEETRDKKKKEDSEEPDNQKDKPEDLAVQVEEMDTTQNIDETMPSREKTPNQYEQLKLNFLSKQKEKLEQELKLLETEKESQASADLQPMPSQSEISVQQEEEMEEEDEDDDLEAMMRKFNEKEKEGEDTIDKREEVEASNSLSALMSDYIDDEIKTGEESNEPIEVPDDENSPEDQVDEVSASQPVQEEPIQIVDDQPPTSNEMDEEALLAATNAAMDIMAPAKRNKRMKAASQLHCSLCKEEGAVSSYLSAYQLLSHVYLVHRKKILARSRKVRGMTLSCPEGCGYITNISKEGTSIDYFTDELPKHLEMLCEHIRDCHTGEPEMETCQYCSLPLHHSQNWSWQHLANHRNIQRFYCDGCNNFPFKNEVHKCPGSGLETYQAATDSSPSTKRRKRTMSEDEVLGKSLEDLEREAEHGSQFGSQASKQAKTLGNLVRFMCGACDRVVTSLSSWLTHIRLDHIGRGHINYSNDVRCFCCPWMPPRFEKGREIIGVNNLVQHLITEHHSEDWKDPEFGVERSRLVQVQKDMERRLDREREEAAILVPKLPAPCPICRKPLSQAKMWRYHCLAHKFGEVYCSSCHTFILGHYFLEHSATCNAEDQNRVKVKLEKYRGDTHLCTQDGTKYKINLEYSRDETGASITVARTMIGSRVVVGRGSSHEDASRTIKDQVENILTEKKLKDEEERKEEIDKEDKLALINLFRQLSAVDKAAESLMYYLEFDGGLIPVPTRFHFTKNGKTMIKALTRFRGCTITALGSSRHDSVEKLAEKIRELYNTDVSQLDEMYEAEDESKQINYDLPITCSDCRTMFRKQFTFNLHRSRPCKA